MATKTPTSQQRDHGTRLDNPKIGAEALDNQIKDPEEWVSGHEPMTGAQASYLKTLSEQAHDPDAYEPNLDKAEALKRIDRLKARKDGS